MLDARPVSNVWLTALLSAKAPWDNLPGIVEDDYADWLLSRRGTVS
jgi:hypothetical protein